MIPILKCVAVLLALSCSTQVGDLSSELTSGRVWLSEINWTSKPRGLSGEFGSGTVLLFEPNGKFRMADCTFTRWNGVVGVSEGDGFIRYTGSWKAAGKTLLVNYALNSPTRIAKKPTVSGSVREERLLIELRDSRIRIARSGKSFYADKVLSKATIAYLFGT